MNFLCMEPFLVSFFRYGRKLTMVIVMEEESMVVVVKWYLCEVELVFIGK